MRGRRSPATIGLLATVGLVVAGLLAAACSRSDSGIVVDRARPLGPPVTAPPGSGAPAPSASTPAGPPPAGAPGTLEFAPCGTRLECGWLLVPRDEADPAAGTFSLWVVRRPAGDASRRIGSLFVNPGGPGFGGAYLVEQAGLIYSEELLERFDVVTWDPRGTGRSEPAIDCVDEMDPYFAYPVPPRNEAEHQAIVDASRAFGEACLERSGEILPYVSTEESARDMDRLRQALGEDRVTYFGFSYGSELGATWATLFPDTVRAAVFDGAVDPNAGYVQRGIDQARGFERQLGAFLAACSDDTGCLFHHDGNAEQAFDALLERLENEPLVVSDDRAPVNRNVLSLAVAHVMYASFRWQSLEVALARAEDGDGAPLLALYDEYYQVRSDGSYGNELDAFLAISCLDDPGPRSVEEADSHIDDYLAVAPRMGPFFAYGYVCALWPVEPAGSITVTGAGAGPILVVGTTGDSATPIESTRAMAATLEDGHLVVNEADNHTGYGQNRCVVATVDRYLIDLVVPDAEVYCS